MHSLYVYFNHISSLHTAVHFTILTPKHDSCIQQSSSLYNIPNGSINITIFKFKYFHKNFIFKQLQFMFFVGSSRSHFIIIFIIWWHYNPLWVFTFWSKSLPVLLSSAVSFQFLTSSSFRSSITSSCHHCLGLPTGLIPIRFQSSSFLVGLVWSILWTCPSHLILCALMDLTISAPSTNLSISMLFRILHILSILTGPNILLSIFLSKMRRLFWSSTVNVQVSDEYVTTGLVILVFFFKNFDFISFALA